MISAPARALWETALGELQIQVSKQNYRTWLARTTGLSYQDRQFTVGVPNTFVAEYLDKKQRSLIEKTLIGLTGSEVEVVFDVDNNRSRGTDSPVAREACHCPFNPKYTFDSFVVGDCNRLAYSAALAIVDSPARTYNPLFIYGGSGLGKTHLMHAIGHSALSKHLSVLYVSAERFTNEFVAAICERKTEDFHRKYRTVDMLLVDDIQFLSGKEQTEESFFHTFNELYDANRQIAITCDLPPKSLASLQARLRSRFEGGLIAGIEPPDFDTRLGILQAKAKQQGLAAPVAALELIAQRATQNIRELEGLLNRTIAYARLVGTEVTPELTARAIEDIASSSPENSHITPSQIIEAVASSYHLTPTDLKGRKRDRATALARQVAMYLMRQEINCSQAQIGDELGGRDHSTVIHACDKIAHVVDNNPILKRQVDEIKRLICSRQKAPTGY